MNRLQAYFCIIVLVIIPSVAFAQSSGVGAVGEPNPEEIGVDAAQQKLKEISITKFEDAGFWSTSMGRDFGLISNRRLEGGPLDKEPIPDEENIGLVESDRYVLGVKIEFFKRGVIDFMVFPSRPLPIEGITKTISVWVVGRNTKHTLKVLISDHFGNKAEITMGTLNFTGWKKLTVAIPTSVVQRDYHYNNRMGIKFDGFKIECDLVETYGSYYLYLDDMRAVTDLFAEESRDIDDMSDTW
jgi:hypothetical protein